MLEIDIIDLEKESAMMEQIVPPNRWKWIYRDVIRYALSLNRQRVRRQENLDGTSYAARKSGKKKKMLLKTLRPKWVKVYYDEKSGSLEITNPVAIAHHEGRDEPIEQWIGKQKKQNAKLGRTLKDPCTKEQAKELQFIIKKRRSVKYLHDRFTIGQAGAIIRKHRERVSARAKVIKLESREILGFTKQDIKLISARTRELILKHSYFKK